MSPRRFGIWPTLPVDVYLRTRSNLQPFPLDRSEAQLFSRARHALWSACKAIGLQPGDEVMAPAYHHGSEIEALLRSGLRISFFDVTEKLEPDPDEIARAFRPNVRVFYLIHYLGFPQDVRYWRGWCDERGLLLFEDAAQAWLATRDGLPVGSLGDMGIYCLYKTIGIPDGAALISRTPARHPRSRAKTGLYGAMKRHGAWLAQRSGVAGGAFVQLSKLGAPAQHGTRSREAEFELGNPEQPSLAASWLLPRILDPTIAERRRNNYRFLLDQLSPMVPGPFRQLPDGACPFAFPIETTEATRMAERLQARGVKALLLWKHPHPSLDVPDFPTAKRFRETVVALPVHQELRYGDLGRIAEAVRTVLPPNG